MPAQTTQTPTQQQTMKPEPEPESVPPTIDVQKGVPKSDATAVTGDTSASSDSLVAFLNTDSDEALQDYFSESLFLSATLEGIGELGIGQQELKDLKGCAGSTRVESPRHKRSPQRQTGTILPMSNVECVAIEDELHTAQQLQEVFEKYLCKVQSSKTASLYHAAMREMQIDMNAACIRKMAEELNAERERHDEEMKAERKCHNEEMERMRAQLERLSMRHSANMTVATENSSASRSRPSTQPAGNRNRHAAPLDMGTDESREDFAAALLSATGGNSEEWQKRMSANSGVDASTRSAEPIPPTIDVQKGVPNSDSTAEAAVTGSTCTSASGSSLAEKRECRELHGISEGINVVSMAKASKNASRTRRRTKATAKEAAELINPAMRGMHEDIAEALEKAGKEREEFEDRLSETVQAESSKILAGQSNILTTQKKERRDEGAAMRAWMTENLKPAGAASAAELAQAKSERDAQQRRALKFKDDVDALSKSQKAT